MLEAHRLVADAPVEWQGDDERHLGLRHGQPGRISLPDPRSVFVEWAEVDDETANHVVFVMADLGHLTEDEYEQRAARLRDGLAPIPD